MFKFVKWDIVVRLRSVSLYIGYGCGDVSQSWLILMVSWSLRGLPGIGPRKGSEEISI